MKKLHPSKVEIKLDSLATISTSKILEMSVVSNIENQMQWQHFHHLLSNNKSHFVFNPQVHHPLRMDACEIQAFENVKCPKQKVMVDAIENPCSFFTYTSIVEGLKIQSGIFDHDAPSSIKVTSTSEVGSTEHRGDYSVGSTEHRGDYYDDSSDYLGAKDTAKYINGLLDLFISLDEWLRLDCEMSGVGKVGGGVSEWRKGSGVGRELFVWGSVSGVGEGWGGVVDGGDKTME